ncbi:MAG: DUF1428 domain-containing protein [Opitutaceae bacterium]|nr:DUF1428 domain-containing protein [Opitutaceae bacterium]
MPKYVDGFVIPIARKKIPAYRRIAKLACKVWLDHGALQYRECVGDDLKVKCGLPFSKIQKLKPGETVVFAWIEYRSRAHRDRVNAAVMKDPRMQAMMGPDGCPFDVDRMQYGGFKVIVEG